MFLPKLDGAACPSVLKGHGMLTEGGHFLIKFQPDHVGMLDSCRTENAHAFILVLHLHVRTQVPVSICSAMMSIALRGILSLTADS